MWCDSLSSLSLFLRMFIVSWVSTYVNKFSTSMLTNTILGSVLNVFVRNVLSFYQMFVMVVLSLEATSKLR